MHSVSSEQGRKEVKGKGPKVTKRKWTRKEDKALIASLLELCNAGWKRDNGILKTGYTSILEKELKSRIPGCSLKATPHIESRIKLLKRQYDEITEMRGTAGMQWSNEDVMIVCEDDDVWEDWVQVHPYARGLRNRPFPYYDDLHIIFGNRGKRKGVETERDGHKKLDDEEGNGTDAGIERLSGKSIRNSEVFGINSLDGEYTQAANNSYMDAYTVDVLYENGVYVANKNVMNGALDCSLDPDQEVANDHAEDSMRACRSDDANCLAAGSERTGTRQHQEGSISHKINGERSKCFDSCLSGLGELTKVLGTYLERQQELVSLLVQKLGKEAAAEQLAAEKRAMLNEELKKLPSLCLQARLRAASLIVGSPPKLDLFYSLSQDERREWISMLLSGII